MQKEEILPSLDLEVLKQKATEFAMAGAIKTIEEYYTGYNSPFRKQVEERLKETKISGVFDLPDIVAMINESLTKEIDLLANTCVAKTFVPLVQGFLVREAKDIRFSDILKEFIDINESKDSEDYSISVRKNTTHGWYDIFLSFEDEKKYDLTLHEDYNTRNQEVKKYSLLSMPRIDGSSQQMMKLTTEEGTLEMPFTTNVLKDKFASYCGRLVLGGCLIEMDCTDFDEEWFYQED